MIKGVYSLVSTLLICAGALASNEMLSLKSIEAIIQENPADAYSQLLSIDITTLKKGKETGLYSLLLSMALDKNYIDIKTDSLIAPAVSYYSKAGDRYHKFLTYYYHGRVLENANQNQKAMDSYLKAEQYINRTLPYEYISRLHARKGRLYLLEFAHDRALEEFRKEKIATERIQDKRFYVNCCLDELSTMISMMDFDNGMLLLDSLDCWILRNNYSPTSKYYATKLGVYWGWGRENRDTVNTYIKKYLCQCNNEGIEPDHLLLSGVNTVLGYIDTAILELERSIPENEFDKIKYYVTLAEIKEKQGQYKEALFFWKKYEAIVNNYKIDIFNNDIRFLEERFSEEMKHEKSKHTEKTMAAIIILLVLGIVAGSCVVYQRKKSYDVILAEAREEYDFLKELMSSNEEPRPEGVDNLLKARIKSIRPYILSRKYLPENAHKLRGMEKSQSEFLNSLGLLYAMTYPLFVRELADHNLTTEEIGLCGMYLSGYSTKELDCDTNKSKLYRKNSEIRKKLNIPSNGIKLNTWLKSRLEDLNCR